MSKIIVHIDGGTIQWATIINDKRFPGMKPKGIIIVDTDVDAVDDGVTVITDSNNRECKAYIHEEDLYTHDKSTDIGHLVETYFDNKDIDHAEDTNELPLLLPKMRTKEGRERIGRILKGED